MLGAVLLKGVKDVLLGDLPRGWQGPFVVGTLAALGSGLLAIDWLLGYVRRHTYGVFVVYRLVVAAIIVLLIVSGARDGDLLASASLATGGVAAVRRQASLAGMKVNVDDVERTSARRGRGGRSSLSTAAGSRRIRVVPGARPSAEAGASWRRTIGERRSDAGDPSRGRPQIADDDEALNLAPCSSAGLRREQRQILGPEPLARHGCASRTSSGNGRRADACARSERLAVRAGAPRSPGDGVLVA